MVHAVVLLVVLGVQDPPKTNLEAAFKSLSEEHAKADLEFWRPWREAKTEEQREKFIYDPSNRPSAEYARKFKDLAARAKGTDTGAKALMKALHLGVQVLSDGGKAQDKTLVLEALDSLMADYAESSALEELPQQLDSAHWSLDEEKVNGALAKLAEKSPHKNVRAAATFSLASILANGRPDEARKLFETLRKDYGDTAYAKYGDAYLFEIEHLAIGMAAPDFEATDQEGKKFKLSEYRGKVTVVDFWGYW
ncbi:MAG: peroxiredoxin family protein [Acidobacteria bacterium]|nr:peroxiredoxin family protein [Acidobacteriota bacterium]